MSLKQGLRDVAFGLLMVFLVMAIFVALPILIPVVGFLHRRDRRRMLTAACSSNCARCGAILGGASLDRADKAWAEHLAALQRDRPGIRFRLVRSVWAVCTACGARYSFDADIRTFGLLP
jgi:hypothetical protein